MRATLIFITWLILTWLESALNLQIYFPEMGITCFVIGVYAGILDIFELLAKIDKE